MASPVVSNLAEATPPSRVRPEFPLNKSIIGYIFDPVEPIIPRLAQVARRKEVEPKAGGVAISRNVFPDIGIIPPECMLYEDNRYNLKLGKAPPHRNYPHVLPPDAWQSKEEITKIEARLDSLTMNDIKETQKLAKTQSRVKAEIARMNAAVNKGGSSNFHINVKGRSTSAAGPNKVSKGKEEAKEEPKSGKKSVWNFKGNKPSPK